MAVTHHIEQLTSLTDEEASRAADIVRCSLPHLPLKQTGIAVEQVAHAFASDELIGIWVHGRDLDISKRWWAIRLKQCLAVGNVYSVNDGQGYAAWLPPGVNAQSSAAANASSGFDAYARDLQEHYAWKRFSIMRAAMAAFDTEASHFAPAWHLQIVAVDPRHQGKGLGSALIRDFINRNPTQSLDLDTESERDIRFYRRFGFDVVLSKTIEATPDMSLNFRRMLRRPDVRQGGP